MTSMILISSTTQIAMMMYDEYRMVRALALKRQDAEIKSCIACFSCASSSVTLDFYSSRKKQTHN